ncbi:serpin family protein [candidate division KSB1 bacterium]
MRKILLISFGLFFLFSMIRCSDEKNPLDIQKKEKGLPRELTSSEISLITSGNQFSFNIFKETVNAEQDKNIFISPLSISMALGMTYNGAGGTTEEAMKTTLGFDNMTVPEINSSYKSLLDLLLDLDEDVIMQIANSIWIRENFPVEQEFIDLNSTYFDAEVTELDFSLAEAIEIINGWVNENTNGKIEEIIDQIDPLTVMFLINALYFKGTWTYEFDPQETKDDDFYLEDGTAKTCRMMNLEGELDYYDNMMFQAVELPYGAGNYCMTVVLPREGTQIDDLISQLNDETWNSWINSFSSTNVDLYLPKFKLEYEILLNDILSSLGMGIAFTGGADFTKINPVEQLFISKVKHKTFVDVNEEGTEAAAVTVVEMQLTSAPVSTTMKVDRPFIFVIRESNSGTMLFMGKITEPSL